MGRPADDKTSHVMTHHDAFLQAIREAPEDDTPRLVYADWLDENGDSERAEFIRVQCDLARREPSDPRYPDLHLCQLEMLARHEREWLGEWADRLVRWDFRRGLLDAVTITPEPFLRHGPDLFARHPVRRVAFVNDEGESLTADTVREVVAAPTMRFVSALETAGCRPDEPMWAMYGGVVETGAWLKALADAAHVTQLEELNLAGGTRGGREAIPQETWRDFCRAPHLHTLRRLDFSDAYGHYHRESFPEIVAELGQAAFAKGLRSLSLSGCRFTDEAARRLAGEPALAGLEELDLSSCDLLRTEGLRAILESSILTRISSLGTPYGLELQVLGSSPSLARLRSLHLLGMANDGVSVSVGNRMEPLGRHVGSDEWTTLFRSPYLEGLTHLSIVADTIPPDAVASLLRTPWTVNLRELNLPYHNARAESFQPLFARPTDGPTALHTLRLPSIEGLGESLARWPGLAGLTELRFSRFGFESADCMAVLRSSYLSGRLTRLDVTGTCRTPEAVACLAECSALNGLRWLGFGYNEPTPEKMTRLLRSPHLGHLESLHMGSEYSLEDEGRPSEEALILLATSDGLPRLRDVVVGSETPERAIDALSRRFGPRLRVWCDY
ncbi:MAG TPA: TIGR02996 domain-containing protein [Gemmataceae bacterium]|jgi:uncharacterized protein (TIGR02996 family)